MIIQGLQLCNNGPFSSYILDQEEESQARSSRCSRIDVIMVVISVVTKLWPDLRYTKALQW